MKRKNISSVPNVVITPLKGVSKEEILAHYPITNLILSETPIAIEKAINNKRQTAIVVEINNSGFFIELQKKWWVNALNSCLKHYETNEQFEKCEHIKKILNMINEQSKKPTDLNSPNNGFK